MNFEEYLISKKIDSHAFRKAEPALFKRWELEFEQMHPKSFTLQKLNLINPVRRKYTLKEDISKEDIKPSEAIPASKPAMAKPGKPVIKPKIN